MFLMYIILAYIHINHHKERGRRERRAGEGREEVMETGRQKREDGGRRGGRGADRQKVTGREGERERDGWREGGRERGRERERERKKERERSLYATNILHARCKSSCALCRAGPPRVSSVS